MRRSFALPARVAVALLCALPAADLHAADDARNPDLWPDIEIAVRKDAAQEQKIDALIARMSLDEKVGQLIQAEIQSITPADAKKFHIGSILNGGGSYPGLERAAPPVNWLAVAEAYYKASTDTDGGKRTGIPIIWGTDAVHGHNNVRGAVLYPHNIGLGATGDAALLEQIGAATARTVRVTGINWAFAPTLAVARDDRWGRTYESYSEDPALVARLGGAMVRGLQGTPADGTFMQPDRVVATAKHFIGDGGTTRGDDQGNTELSEADLIRLHGQGYVSALSAGAQAVMASFSSWNGEKMHGHRYLLTDILKGRWGFDGLVVGDWNGHGQLEGCSDGSCAKAVNAGVDLIMVPSQWKDFFYNLRGQVEAGEVSMERLEDAVRRILRVKMRAGLFDGVKPSESALAGRDAIVGHDVHRRIAREAVRKSLVLLKNDNAVLPLSADSRIVVAGPGARNIPMQSGGWSVTWQGRDTDNEDFPGATTIAAGLEEALTAGGGDILSNAEATSATPDAAVLVFGETPYAELEGDLESDAGVLFEDPATAALMARWKADGVPVIAVFLSGRPRHLGPLMDEADAFVAAWLPGTEGDGVADILVAGEDGEPRYDFTGRLSFSWPAGPNQHPVNRGDDKTPLFPFGYGLSYD